MGGGSVQRGRGVSTAREGRQYGVRAVFCPCGGTWFCSCQGVCRLGVTVDTVEENC